MAGTDGIDDPDLAEALLKDEEGVLSQEIESFLRAKLAAISPSDSETDCDSAKVRKACETSLGILKLLPVLRKPSSKSS